MAQNEVLGLDIGAYDQVVALSQDTINNTLQYRLRDLEEWEAEVEKSFPQLGCSLRGSLEMPTVWLIDLPNREDGALFQVKLGRNFSFQFPGNDGKPMTAKVGGSTLAFALKLDLDVQKNIPPEVRKQIEDPGSYTISQLSVDLSHASLTTFRPTESTIVGLETHGADAMEKLTNFIASHLTDLGRQNRTALGYAMTALKPELSYSGRPTYPPTSVQLQTMYHRANGDKSTESRKSSQNVFLFAEMCQNRAFTGRDLDWTSNWTILPFNGALVISKRIIWDLYFKPVFQNFDQTVLEALNKAMHATQHMSRVRGVKDGWILTNESSPTLSRRVDPLCQYTDWSYERPVALGDPQFFIHSSLHSHALKEKGTGDVKYKATGEVSGTLQHTHNNEFMAEKSWKLNVTYDAVCKLASIKGGKLEVIVTTTNPAPTIEFDRKALSTSQEKQAAFIQHDVQYMAKECWQNAYNALADVTFSSKISQAFQLPFCVPGGTTFDFKNPMWLNNGDLYVALAILFRAMDDQKTISTQEKQTSR